MGIADIFDKAKFKKLLSTLSWVTIILIATNLVNAIVSAVVYRKYLYTTQNYPWVANQLTNLLPIPLFYGMVLKHQREGSITPEMKKIPQRLFIEIGIYSTLQNWAGTFGANWISGTLSTLLSQANIPITMVMSIFLLKGKFKPAHYIGASVIIAGVIIAVTTGQNSGGTAVPASKQTLGVILYLFSTIFSSLQYIRMEKIFKDVPCDVWYLQFWICLYNFIFTFIVWPLNIPVLGESSTQMDDDLGYGIKCFGGENSLPGDDCGDSAGLCIAFMSTWVIGTITATFLVKRVSAALVTLLGALALPLTSVAFSIKAFMGINVTPFDGWLILAIILVFVGIGIYRSVADATAIDNGNPGSEMMATKREDLSKKLLDNDELFVDHESNRKLSGVSSALSSSRRYSSSNANQFDEYSEARHEEMAVGATFASPIPQQPFKKARTPRSRAMSSAQSVHGEL